MLKELLPTETVEAQLEDGKVAIAKFATTTCPPCKMLKPIFEKLAELEELSDVVFIAADANEHPQSRDFQVSSVPTLLFFKGKEFVGQNVGFVPEQPLIDALKKLQTEMVQ